MALDALLESGVPFLVGGALAMNKYTGIWRNTKDLDLFVKPSDVDRVCEVLEGADFDTEAVDRVWLFKAWGERDAMIDIICRNANGLGEVEDDWWDRAPEADVLGRQVPVVSAEDVLLSKMFVGFRNRWDGSDVLHLLYATEGDLDWDYMIERAGEHWELLLTYLTLFRYAYPGYRECVPNDVYDALLERASRTENRDDGPAFRGTLFDSVSFRVDVEEWDLPDVRAATRRRHVPEAEP